MEKLSLSSTQIRDEIAMVTLCMEDNGNYALHPIWKIRLPLDKAYGAVTNIHALLWADSGKIAYLEAVGSYGIPQNQGATSDNGITASQTRIEQGYAVIGVLIAVIVIVSSYLFFKRKV
jgi:hypothetical protein